VKIISEHNPMMASRLRTNPAAHSHVVEAAKYASDVAVATGNTSALKQIVVRAAFEDIATAETHAQKVARGLMEQTSESRSEKVYQPDIFHEAWIVWQGALRLYRVAVMSFVPVYAYEAEISSRVWTGC
jgi:hypothetical protein